MIVNFDTEKKTATELVEEGLGLIAAGTYREGSVNKNPSEAIERLDLVLSILMNMKQDYLKIKNAGIV